MQEHPIPQDITNYRFHIIGSMTLKQFGEVLLGVIIAFVIFQTNLIDFIKWPLILSSVGIGFAMAFVPIEERPLDHWIFTFFSVLYKPTKFFWKREPHIPDLFTFKPREDTKNQEPVLDLTPAKRERIKEYLGAVPQKKSVSSDFNSDELLRMQSILNSFTDVSVAQTTVTKMQPKKEKPRMDVRVRKMRKPVDTEDIIFENTNTYLDIDQTNSLNQSTPTAKSRLSKNKSMLSPDQVAQDIQVPKEELIKNSNQQESKEQSFKTPLQDTSHRSFLKSESNTHEDVIAQSNVSYNSDLPFPIKPTEPNKVVGMVLSPNNEIITNAIIEIQTPDGAIARAVKTNALGQFFITTPLKPGDYNIIIEKKGFQFTPQHLKIDGSIVPPMEIRSNT